jgi:integrase
MLLFCWLCYPKVLPSAAMKAHIRGLFEKRGWYYYRGPQKEGARPKAVALRTQDLGKALELIREIQSRDHLAATQEPMRAHVEQWLLYKRRCGEHSSDATTQTARPALNRFLKAFKCAAAAVETGAVERWKGDLLSEALSPATIAGYMRYCQSFFSWLVDRGQVVQSPFDRVTFPKSLPTKRELVCSKAERDRLLAWCTNRDLRAVLYFGFHAGLRRNEILNLRPHWIVRDAHGWPIYLRVQNEVARDGLTAFRVKDGEAKVIPINRRLAKFLVFDHRIEAGAAFVIAPQYRPGKNKYRWDWKRLFRSHVKRCGLPWVTPHVMRHTFISLLLSGDPASRPSLLHLARWTGTGEAVLMKTYAHLVDDRGLIEAAN